MLLDVAYDESEPKKRRISRMSTPFPEEEEGEEENSEQYMSGMHICMYILVFGCNFTVFPICFQVHHEDQVVIHLNTKNFRYLNFILFYR